MNEETPNCTVCKQPLDQSGRCPHCDEDAHVWSIADWRSLLNLSMIIVLAFSFTRLVVTLSNQQRNALAAEYTEEGNRQMEAQRPAEAVKSFESALAYSRGSFDTQLKLTDALAASGDIPQALAQLQSFREQRPTDARLNLKLARLEAARKNVDKALSYYSAAIEGTWPDASDPAAERVAVRFEAASYLVDQGRQQEAESALLALTGILPPNNAAAQERLAKLFLRNGDSRRALILYQTQLAGNRSDGAALLGAAEASYALGNYDAARHYLEQLPRGRDAAARGQLAQLERMESLDPFASGTNERTRNERIVGAFHIALNRLALCGVPFAQQMTGNSASAPVANPAAWSNLETWAQQLAPLMKERRLRGDVMESAMRFAFQAEMTAEKECAASPSPNDEALLLLARERLGVGQ